MDFRMEQKLLACKRLGQSINMAVERLITIGESVADGYIEVKDEMFDYCKDCRDTGKSIEELCAKYDINIELINKPILDNTAIVLASRSLLATITRILLLVDVIVVKQLFAAIKPKDMKDMKRTTTTVTTPPPPHSLERIMNFAKFVEAFSVFGSDMVELMCLISNSMASGQEQRRRTEILAARQVLEHSLKILISTSKVCLVHYNCMLARENRNTVFCQIRRGMDHLHFIVKDTILESEWHSSNEYYCYYNMDDRGTIHTTIKHFTYLMQCCRFNNKFNDYYLRKQTASNNHDDIFNTNIGEKSWPIDNYNYNIAYQTVNERHHHQQQPHHQPHHHQPHHHHHHHHANLFDDNHMYDDYTSTYTTSQPYSVRMKRACSQQALASGLATMPSQTQTQSPLQTMNTFNELVDRLLISFDKILENIHDFTDSAYTSHEMRENILHYCDKCTRELNKYLRYIMNPDLDKIHYGISMDYHGVNDHADIVLANVKMLSDQLNASAIEQSHDLFRALQVSNELVNSLHACITQQNFPQFNQNINEFDEHCDHILEVCKLLRHISIEDTLKEHASHVSINLRIYGPQVILAAKILNKFPLSNTAGENFSAFIEMWNWLTDVVRNVAKQIIETTTDINEDDVKYLTLKNKSTVAAAAAAGATNAVGATAVSCPEALESIKPTKSVNFQNDLPQINKEEIAIPPDAETEPDADSAAIKNDLQPPWSEDLCDNDIIKRAKNLSAMAFLMYQFTKGNGTLRTTQDLFTQAEYFAEEANRLYKVLRQFSYQVPASVHKKDLLDNLDSVPAFVQGLQFTVKDHTVGSSATLIKVDNVILETKNLMCVINNVVTKCIECATKYNLDFNSIVGGISTGPMPGDDCSGGATGDTKGITNSSEGSMRHYGMARRAKADGRRTRVSFLLF